MSQRATWKDGFSHRLIHYAAARAPDALSERLEEEWQADMAARPTGSARLRFAIGCCWATRVIAYEYHPSVRVAGAVMEVKLALTNAQYSLGYFSRRSSAFFLVVVLHVALFYVLVTKLSHTHYQLPPQDITIRPVDQVVEKHLPPTQRPQVDQLKIHADPPEVITPSEDPKTDVVSRTEETPKVEPRDDSPPPPPPVHVVQRVSGGPGIGFPVAEDYYPDAAKRLAEQGNAIVQSCVDAKGRLTSEPTLLQSTGSARLDDGALKLAKAGSGHYRASTEDGQPVNSCYAFRIRFQLKNQRAT